MTSRPEPESFLPLSHMALHVLLALVAGPAHGYAIGKDAEERTGGSLKPTTGGLYLALRRLRDDGLVVPAEADPESTDSRRQYFGLTPLGRRVLEAELGRLKAIVAGAEDADLIPKST